MNIFFLSKNPKLAAQLQIDAHVRKMPSECAIMLANAYSKDQLLLAPKTQKGEPRSGGYPHHGCTKWAISNISNFNWLVEHAIALCEEFEYRFGKVHFCKSFILWCKSNQPSLPIAPMTCPYLAMPVQYKDEDFVRSYINYYLNDKKQDKRGKPMFNWTRREKPAWVK